MELFQIHFKANFNRYPQHLVGLKKFIAILEAILLYCSKVELYKCSIIERIMKDNPDHFNLLRKIKQKPKSNQRELAQELGFSLGKLNYCLKALSTKGLIKINNFKKNPKKFNYVYILTPKGISEKTKLTVNFMKRKMKEYDELKKELDE